MLSSSYNNYYSYVHFADLGDIYKFLLALVSIRSSSSVYQSVNQGLERLVHMAISITAHAQLTRGRQQY